MSIIYKLCIVFWCKNKIFSILFCLSKKVNKKGPPVECFSPLSENNENLSKVVPTQHSRSGNPACSGAFADFQMFSDSRHRRLARQELPAKSRLTYPSKTELFRRNKVRWQENMSVSGSGLCEGSIYIFLNFLVLFVSRQKGQ